MMAASSHLGTSPCTYSEGHSEYSLHAPELGLGSEKPFLGQNHHKLSNLGQAKKLIVQD